jgi:hypothetical protein
MGVDVHHSFDYHPHRTEIVAYNKESVELLLLIKTFLQSVCSSTRLRKLADHQGPKH